MWVEVGHVGGFGVAFGFAVEAREVVPDLRVDGFDSGGERFGLQQQIERNDFTVDFPMIGSDGKGFKVGYSCPEPLERFVATTAHFHGKDASCGARHSNP